MAALRRLALLAVLAVALLAGPVPTASAHAYLTGTGPGDGVTLRKAPREIRLSFSEHVVLRATHIEIVDGAGAEVPVANLHLATEDPDDTEEPAQVVGRLPHLSPSSYRVSWRTLSSDDLHRTSGVFVFGVQRAAPSSGFVEPLPSFGESALRWTLLLGLALGLGGLLARSVMAASGVPDRDLRRAAGLSLAGTLVALAGTAGLLVAQSLGGGVSPADLLSGPYGLRFGVREAGLVLLLLAALASRRAGGRRLRRLLAGVGAALASVGTALAGHAGAGGHVSITRVLATGAHVGAALAWAGAVVCLVVVLLSRKSPGGDNAASVGVLRAFALPASACVSVMAVTGVYLSSKVVASVDAALFSFYGRALLLKVVVAGVAGLFAIVNHRGLRRSHAVVPRRRTLVGEAAAVVVAVAATAVLTSAQPATAPALVRSDDQATRGGWTVRSKTSRRPSASGRTGRVAAWLSSTSSTPGAPHRGPSRASAWSWAAAGGSRHT